MFTTYAHIFPQDHCIFHPLIVVSSAALLYKKKKSGHQSSPFRRVFNSSTERIDSPLTSAWAMACSLRTFIYVFKFSVLSLLCLYLLFQFWDRRQKTTTTNNIPEKLRTDRWFIQYWKIYGIFSSVRSKKQCVGWQQRYGGSNRLTNRSFFLSQLWMSLPEPFSVLLSDQWSPLLADTQTQQQCYFVLKGSKQHETKH